MDRRVLRSLIDTRKVGVQPLGCGDLVLGLRNYSSHGQGLSRLTVSRRRRRTRHGLERTPAADG